MPSSTRRDVLRAGAVLAAGIAASPGDRLAIATPTDVGEKPGPWDHEHTFGHTRLFMDEYHQGSLEILGRISGELPLIGELTSRAARTVQAGGTVWTSMNSGHMPHWEQRADRRGSPRIMKDHGQDQFARLQKGDMVFTTPFELAESSSTIL